MQRLVLVLALLLLIAGCISEEAPSVQEEEGKGVAEETAQEGEKGRVTAPTSRPRELFKGSFWYQNLGDAGPDELSDRAVLTLELAAEDGVALAIDQWTMPVYFADENTPRHDVPLLIDWTPLPKMALRDIPIPKDAREDPATNEGDPESIAVLGRDEAELGDASLVIIDTTTKPWTEIDLWQARQVDEKGRRVRNEGERENAGWVASWGNFISLDSEGIFRCGLSGRGSGAAYLAGMIWPDELIEGIDHKLAVALPFNKAEMVLEPFTETDGYLTDKEMAQIYEGETGKKADAFPIPEGAVLRLNPGIDLDSWRVTDPETGENRKLKPYEKIIAKALQDYGAVNIDNSMVGIQLYAINSISYKNDPYEAIVGKRNDFGAVMLPKELFTDMYLVKMAEPAEIKWGLTKKQWSRYSCDGAECKPPEYLICR